MEYGYFSTFTLNLLKNSIFSCGDTFVGSVAVKTTRGYSS